MTRLCSLEPNRRSFMSESPARMAQHEQQRPLLLSMCKWHALLHFPRRGLGAPSVDPSFPGTLQLFGVEMSRAGVCASAGRTVVPDACSRGGHHAHSSASRAVRLPLLWRLADGVVQWPRLLRRRQLPPWAERSCPLNREYRSGKHPPSALPTSRSLPAGSAGRPVSDDDCDTGACMKATRGHRPGTQSCVMACGRICCLRAHRPKRRAHIVCQRLFPNMACVVLGAPSRLRILSKARHLCDLHVHGDSTAGFPAGSGNVASAPPAATRGRGSMWRWPWRAGCTQWT